MYNLNNLFSKEEKFLIEILFKNSTNKFRKTDIEKLNLDKLIKISSEHLVLPLLFQKIKENKLQKLFESEFCKYLSQIHKLNKKRNFIHR